MAEAILALFGDQLAAAFVDYQEALTLREAGRLWDCYLKLAVLGGQLNSLQKIFPLSTTSTPTAGYKGCFESFAKLKGCVEGQLRELHGVVSAGVSKLKLSDGIKDDADEAIEEACSARIRVGDKDSDDLCENWFRNIIGLAKPKALVEQGFIFPLIYPNLFGKLGGGVLFYGPPGTGKTMMAMAAMNELGYRIKKLGGEACYRFMFFAPTAEKLKGKYVGETEKHISNFFVGASALACKMSEKTGGPVISILFLDEVDAIAAAGRGEGGSAGAIAASSVNTLLQHMQGAGAKKNVIVMAATNFPQNLDSAFLRRLPYQIPIDLPNESDLVDLFNLLLSQHTDPKKEVKGSKRMLDYQVKACEKKTKSSREECEDLTACEEPIFVDNKAWKATEAAPFLSEKLKPENIRAIAAMCAKRHYSGSDMATMFNLAVKMAGAAALNNGCFLAHKSKVDGSQKYVSMLYATVKTPFNKADIIFSEPDPAKQHIFAVGFKDGFYESKYASPVVDTDTEFFSDNVLYKRYESHAEAAAATHREYALVFNVDVQCQNPFTAHIFVKIREPKPTEASTRALVGSALWDTLVFSGVKTNETETRLYGSWSALYYNIAGWLFAPPDKLASWASTPEMWADSGYTWWLFFRDYVEGVYLAKPTRTSSFIEIAQLKRVVLEMDQTAFGNMAKEARMWWYGLTPATEAESEKSAFEKYKSTSHVPLFRSFTREVSDLSKPTLSLQEIAALLTTDKLILEKPEAAQIQMLDPASIRTLKSPHGQGCAKLMDQTAQLVNWHVGPHHFLQAIAATPGSYNKKEYADFQKWRDRK